MCIPPARAFRAVTVTGFSLIYGFTKGFLLFTLCGLPHILQRLGDLHSALFVRVLRVLREIHNVCVKPYRKSVHISPRRMLGIVCTPTAFARVETV